MLGTLAGRVLKSMADILKLDAGGLMLVAGCLVYIHKDHGNPFQFFLGVRKNDATKNIPTPSPHTNPRTTTPPTNLKPKQQQQQKNHLKN